MTQTKFKQTNQSFISRAKPKTMTSFEIDYNFKKEICLNIECINCETNFSTELDSDFYQENFPFSSSGVLHCHDCDMEYQYVIRIDSDKFQITFQENYMIGSLEYSTKPSFEEYKTFSPLKSKRFYYLQIERLQKIIDIETNEFIVDQSLNRLVFSGVITSLETYLNEIYLCIVFYSSNTFEQFVSHYEPYKKETIRLNEIFSKLSKLNRKVKDELDGLIYHNISKLIKLFNMYNFDLQKFEKIKIVAKHIQTRHNFIHRSGIDKNDNFQEISKSEVLLMMDDSNDLVDYIFDKFEKRCFLPDQDLPF